MTTYIARDSNTACLAHHGVKGMKWGVRHERKPSGKRFKGRSRRTYKDRIREAQHTRTVAMPDGSIVSATTD